MSKTQNNKSYDYNTDDNDFLRWSQDDLRFNRTEMFDAENYPDAKFRYLKDSGCLIVALSIMLRLFGIEKETDFNKFNPLIFCERAKAAGCFSKSGNFIFPAMPRLYPIEKFEAVPYSREAMIESFNKGYASILMVPGVNCQYHYVVPYKILDNDVSVIDRKFGKTLVSQYKEVYYILNFRRID